MPEPHSFVFDLVAMVRQTLDGRIVDCNEACARILGYGSREELLAAGRFDYVNQSDPITVSAALRELGSLSSVELALRRKDGSVAWVLQNLRLSSSGDTADVAMFDVTDQRVAAQSFEYQAYHDSLTKLPGRNLVMDRIHVALALGRRRRNPVAVMMVDLDHFELINTAFGHGIADRLLKSVAARLETCIRSEDCLGRLGSDEFVMVLQEVKNDTDAAVVAQRVLDMVSEAFVIEGHRIDVRASIGISVSPQDGTDPEILLQHASAAMYQAKERGRNTYHFYAAAMNARAFERASLKASIWRAIERKEFELFYHPEVNVQTGRIDCIEALIRWRHPDLGLIGPAEFLPLAEQANLDAQIGQWVISEACRQARLWRDEGISGMRVSVNLSARQFQDRDLSRLLSEAVAQNGLDSASIELEVTERSLVDTARTVQVLRALKDFGVRLAVDDFGSGGCSISELKEMPVDTIKIAPTFVQNMMRRSGDAAIVQAMITMSKGLDFRVVAEGVESKEQLAFLLNRRCPDMQGFFFGKPAPASALADTLRLQH
jgi:diguanylate cyclase (GGDEF)-like protein/PAS domain S-box-containing protein